MVGVKRRKRTEWRDVSCTLAEFGPPETMRPPWLCGCFMRAQGKRIGFGDFGLEARKHAAGPQ